MELSAGIVVKSHGIKGELVVEVTTDYPEERFAVGNIITLKNTSGTTSQHEVVAARWHQGRLIVRLDDIINRTEADELRCATFLVSADTLEELVNPESDEYHITILIGLTAKTQDGQILGVVTDLLKNTAQDLLVITDDGGEEHLVPFVKALVPVVNIDSNEIVCDLPEGLWELS